MLKKIAKLFNKKPLPSYLLPRDRQKISDLTEEKLTYMEKLDDIDEQLFIIQKSTKTTFRYLSTAHNYCR